jgi:molecular chaperone GrpE
MGRLIAIVSEETITEQSSNEQEAAPDAVVEPGDETQVEQKPVEEQLAEAQAKAAEYLDGWQRARAELDNYRKRMARERNEWGDTLRAEFILNVLPALDDFDLALMNLPDDIANHQWVNGVILAHRKLAAQLEALGVSEIAAVGQSFDPAVHEAVTHEASKDHRSGEVIDVVRKGYRLGEKVIRPAMVRVAA